MKDKVQKIREKIGEMVNSINPFVPDEDGKNSDYEAGKLDAATQILQMMDSLEEPVSNDVLDTVDKEAKKIWSEINTGHEYSIIDSYNQFYGICMEIAENVKEEPVSERKCMFTKDSYTDEDRKVLCEDCKEKCEYSKKEEPVSECLEEAVKGILKNIEPDTYHIINQGSLNEREEPAWSEELVLKAIKASVQWQKQQDQEKIELAEDHAMLAGMEKMKEQMMAEAIDVEVKVDAGGYPYIDKTIELYDYDNDVPLAKEGDTVRVIVIKED